MYLRKVIAHRGFSHEYPENTMLAFQKAIELGIIGTEKSSNSFSAFLENSFTLK